MITIFCPCCHRPLAEPRAGVRLPALKVRIFDLVERAGMDGILIDDINDIAFDGQAKPVTIRNHIQQINDRLDGTGVSIRGDKPMRGYYRLVRKQKKGA